MLHYWKDRFYLNMTGTATVWSICLSMEKRNTTYKRSKVLAASID